MLQLDIVDGQGRRTVNIERSPFSIGRSSENMLQLADAQVSRRHAELITDAEGWRIRDCGSRFGTYLNEAKIEESPVRPGDRIRIGGAELRISDGLAGGTAS